MSRRLCTEITQFCTEDLTVYGYRPDLAGNAFFLTAFAIILVAQTFLGLKYRTWSWLAALVLGCALEVRSFSRANESKLKLKTMPVYRLHWKNHDVCRCQRGAAGADPINRNRNPWSDIAFRMQIACLILGPSFISAGIDLVLKWTGEGSSREAQYRVRPVQKRVSQWSHSVPSTLGFQQNGTHGSLLVRTYSPYCFKLQAVALRRAAVCQRYPVK